MSTTSEQQQMAASAAEAPLNSTQSLGLHTRVPSGNSHTLGPYTRVPDSDDSALELETIGTHGHDKAEPVAETRSGIGVGGGGASMLSSFFNLTNAIVGAGVIGLPYAMRQAGFVVGLAMVIILALLVDWTLRVLAVNSKLSGRQTYQDMVEYCFGRWGLLASSFFQGAMAGGGMASFIVIVGDTLPHVLGALMPSIGQSAFGHIVFSRRFVIAFFVIFMAYPLSLYRDVGKLGKTSAFAVVAMCTIIAAVVVEGPRIDSSLRASPEKPLQLANTGIFQAVGVITFAFVCHHNSFMIYGSLRKPTLNRYFEVIHLSTAIATVASLIIAVFGYVYFGEKTQGNILNNFPQDNLLINIARFLFALNMITTFPMETLVAREVIESLAFRDREFSMRRHVWITTALCAAGLAIGETVCNLGVLLELTGGMSASFLAFILPSACFIKLSYSSTPLYSRKLLGHWLCIIFGVTVMLLSTVLSIRHAAQAGSGPDAAASCWRDVPGKCSDYPKLEVPSGFGLDVHTTNSKSSATLTYNFDGVFGPRTTQEQIYEKVASPILEEVMQGYSCTIFAYGQTGTGKTYTMQGDLESANLETSNGGVVKGDPLASLQVSTNAGLIPRTLHNLFYILDKQSADYKVHVSYVELYNEELVDLLSSGNSGKGAGIKLLDSGQDKGMFILNLTEVRVLKAKDAMDLLEDGTQRRKVAATRCNKESSRSHAIFTISVKITERDETGDGQVIEKLGKLNLVDLAGSENVGRSGADARETSSINKSLLALGQVIAAVAKRSPHVPYRDSKLTQMLRDSLGGHTRACMIATIDTSQQSFPETVKTLKYASQAKDVRNKPIANKCVVRADIVDSLQKEIDKLRFDLKAARDGEGFYLTSDTYKALTEGAALANTQAEGWKLRVDLLETEILKSRADAELQTTRIDQLERNNVAAAEALQESLAQQERLVEQLKAESLLTRAHAYHEQELGITARQLRTDLAESRSEGELLHDKTMRLADREQRNVEAATRVSHQAQADAEQVLAQADALGARAANHVGSLLAALQSRIGEDFDRSLAAHVDTHTLKLRAELERVAETYHGESESKAGLIGVALEAADTLSAGLRSAVEAAAAEIDSACVALAAGAQTYQLQLSEQLRSSAAAVRRILDTAQADSDTMLREAQAQSEQLIKQIRTESLELQQRSASDVAALQRQVEELQAEELKADESDMLVIAQMLAQRRKRGAAMSSVILERATAS
ncbi:hypothetical protein GGH92_001388, partial [Coemansia sp. RSA 2673]